MAVWLLRHIRSVPPRAHFILILLLPTAACESPSEAERPAEIQLSTDLASVDVGQTIAITAKVLDASGAPMRDGTIQLQWSSSDTAVATVKDGTVSGRAIGNAIITATAGGTQGEVAIAVEPRISSVSVLAPAPHVGVGASMPILGWISGVDGANVATHSYLWTSSDTSVLQVRTVSRQGQLLSAALTGAKPGSAIVTLRAGAVSREIPVSVERSYSVTVVRTATTPLYLGRLNGSGQTVWYESTSTGDMAFLWRDGSVVALGAGQAWDINDRGEIVGCSGANAVVWRAGVPSVVYSKDRSLACATAINNAGRMAGYATHDLRLSVTFLVEGGVPRELEGTAFLPRAINDGGWIVGSSFDRDPRPFLFRDGALIGLPSTPGAPSSAGFAKDVNRDGTIAGIVRPSYPSSGVTWKGTELSARLPGAMTLNCEDGDAPFRSMDGGMLHRYPGAHGINDSGEVVGADSCHGNRWRGQQRADLQYLHTDPSWIVDAAVDVNEQGQILASAFRRGSTTRGILILSPAQ